MLTLGGCASARPGSPVLPPDAAGPRAEVYVFNVSSGTMIPFRRYVTIDGFPMIRLWCERWGRVQIKPGPHEIVMDGQRVLLDTVDGGIYYVAVGHRPTRAWLLPEGAHPIFIRRIHEADALRLFTEMKEAQ